MCEDIPRWKRGWIAGIDIITRKWCPTTNPAPALPARIHYRKFTVGDFYSALDKTAAYHESISRAPNPLSENGIMLRNRKSYAWVFATRSWRPASKIERPPKSAQKSSDAIIGRGHFPAK